jgi:hypothetical protein
MVQFKMFFVKLKRKQKIQFNKIEHIRTTNNHNTNQ